VEITRWWNIWENANPAAKDLGAEGIRKQVKALLDQSIQRRMVSDVPIGAFLSGGIDSSAIVALMAQASEQPVDTFSVVFEEKEYNESQWSELIAKQYNTRHHPILLKPTDFLDALPAALSAMDHPSGDGINSYVVSGLTREKGVKVALSGLGGDELFGGYPIFTQLPAIMQKKLLKLPYGLRMLAAKAIGMSGSRRSEKISSLMQLPEPSLEAIYGIFRTIYNWQDLQKQLGLPKGFAHPLAAVFEAQAKERKQLPLLSQIGGLEILTYTGNVLLRDTDQMSMAHALEVRVPFFDHDLVEFVMGIPDSTKHPHYPKQLLVESLGPLLPHDLVHRKKMGFVFPWEHWLRHDMKDFCASRIHSLDEKAIMGKPGTMAQIWKQYLDQKGPWLWTHIWLPVVLEEWMNQNNIQA
jgi:asparagine synthase (glutamine-hydrolysing)